MNKNRLFHRFCGLTIFSVIVLFFLGGLVRITGSGMGCPDWPKCFGSWVPPTSADQLPDDYKEVFTQKRKRKVQRLTSFLVKIGMQNKADEINGSMWLMEAHDFSFAKAYTEYINRLWGALTGIFAILTLYFSFHYFKSSLWKMMYAVIGCFFIFYNAWLGSLVVDSNLFGGMVTIHFVVAFLSLLFFMLAFYKDKSSIAAASHSRWHLIAVIFAITISGVQLVSGTFTREAADVLGKLSTVVSTDNYQLLGAGFNLHRVTAPILALVLFMLWFLHRNQEQRKSINKFYLGALTLVVLQIISGSINVSHNFPAFTKLLHVTIGSILLSGMMFISIQEFKAKKEL